MIIDAEQFFGKPGHQAAARLSAERRKVIAPPDSNQRNDVQAIATINHGRWIVNCPWCASAQYGSTTDQRFFCPDCLNGDSYQWVQVEYPSTQLQEAVTEALSERPDPRNQNWVPTESVDDLKAETAAGGDKSSPLFLPQDRQIEIQEPATEILEANDNDVKKAKEEMRRFLAKEGR